MPGQQHHEDDGCRYHGSERGLHLQDLRFRLRPGGYSNAVQIFGGYGYSKEYPVEKLMRDVKVFQIFEGANQVQRLTIANVLNKEYK